MPRHREVARAALLAAVLVLAAPGARGEPIYISFVWHMHQPIYWPGEDLLATAGAGRYSFDVAKVHTDRTGPYTGWPRDAVGAARAAGLTSCGAQVSLTGSLMENLDVLEAGGRGFSGWRTPWQEAAAWRTPGGHPALDLIGFGYFHPLSALIDREDLVRQIRIHRLGLSRRFPGHLVSRGIFPPETAFSPRMIPALVEAGIEWAVVDNIHFDRTLPDYPYTAAANLYPPNRADQRNAASVSWVQLRDLWAPSRVSAPWGYQPHRARHVDPATGATSEIVVVPGARYEGNEDARGGFGALNYEQVLSQLEPYNTDPQHPILVVLHHDGDNYGGGTDSYYHSNFQGFVSWLGANPTRFQCITVQEYLQRFPPAAGDVIHVEDGSWSGADNGDPEFLKWNADPAAGGYSPDRHSWAVIAAARNRVRTATAAAGAAPSDADILDGNGDLGRAWRYLLMAEASDYWYWDFSENGVWDSHPTRAANLATAAVDPLLSSVNQEAVPPTLHVPQRQPYNPGALEWGPALEDEAVTIWTLAYDFSGLSRVELKYRIDADGVVDGANLRYDGATWCSLPMVGTTVPSQSNPAPTHIAERFEASLPGLGGRLVDYYVEAADTRGNVARSPIAQVWVGDRGGGGTTGGGVSHYPRAPTRYDAVTVVAFAAGHVHWGINAWNEPPAAYWPAGTTAWGDGRAVDTQLVGPASDGRYTAVLGPFDGATTVTRLDYVIHYADDTWSSPDQSLTIDNAPGTSPSVELVSPQGGAAVEGVVRLVAAAGDDGGQPIVYFLVDGVEVGSRDARPYELDWNTAGVDAGSHTLTVRATDGQGNSTEVSAAITVGGGTNPAQCVVVGSGDGGLPPADGGAPTDGGLAPDAGVAQDAGVVSDGGVPPDAGTAPDAGVVVDAGAPADAGSGPIGGSPVPAGSGGCGVGGSGASGSLPLAVLVMLLAAWGWRRRRELGAPPGRVGNSRRRPLGEG